MRHHFLYRNRDHAMRPNIPAIPPINQLMKKMGIYIVVLSFTWSTFLRCIALSEPSHLVSSFSGLISLVLAKLRSFFSYSFHYHSPNISFIPVLILFNLSMNKLSLIFSTFLGTINHLHFTLLCTSSHYHIIFLFLPPHFIFVEQMLLLMLVHCCELLYDDGTQSSHRPIADSCRLFQLPLQRITQGILTRTNFLSP